MDSTIIAAIITGVFTLIAVRYKHNLDLEKSDSSKSNIIKPRERHSKEDRYIYNEDDKEQSFISLIFTGIKNLILLILMFIGIGLLFMFLWGTRPF